ncbi:Ankyrin repeat domain-containing protein 7 [Aphelenchoides avenae]|nr:Ankyrin repeat domain-containing protein 7 [Aphelenchus avenae]
MASCVQKILRVQASRKRKMTAPTYYPPQEEVVKSPTPMNTSWQNYYANIAKVEPSDVQQPSKTSSEPSVVNGPLVGEKPTEVVTAAPTSEESLPLHESAKWRYPVIVADAADVNERDSRLRTPLHWVLVTHNKTAEQKMSDVIMLLEARAEIDTQDDQGKTPLILAIESVLEDIACLLLDRGADPNVPDSRYWTPLHHSVKMLSSRLVEKLLANGTGRTPLFLAANNGSDSATRMLLHLHADSTLADVDDKTPLRAAHEKGFDSVVKVFEEHKATKTNATSGLLTPPVKLRRLKHSPPMDATKVVAKQHSSSGIKLPKPVDYKPTYTSRPYMLPEAAYFHHMTGRQQWHAPQQGSTANTPHAPNNNAWAAQSPHHHHTGLSPMFSSWLPMRDDRAPAFFMQMPNSTPAARPAPPATFHALPQDARGVAAGSAPQCASPQETSCANKPAPNGPQQIAPAAIEKNDIETSVAPQSSVMLTPPSESKRCSSSSAVKPEPKRDGGSEVLDEFFTQHPYNVTQLLSL